MQLGYSFAKGVNRSTFGKQYKNIRATILQNALHKLRLLTKSNKLTVILHYHCTNCYALITRSTVDKTYQKKKKFTSRTVGRRGINLGDNFWGQLPPLLPPLCCYMYAPVLVTEKNI